MASQNAKRSEMNETPDPEEEAKTQQYHQTVPNEGTLPQQLSPQKLQCSCKTLLFVLGSLIFGMIFGFIHSCRLVVMNWRVDTLEMSHLMLFSLPLGLKFLYQTIIDVYYIQWLGKFKTHVVLGNIVLVLLLVGWSTEIEGIVNNQGIHQLWNYGFLISVVLGLINEASTKWHISLYPKEQRANAGGLSWIFDVIGMTLSVYLVILSSHSIEDILQIIIYLTLIAGVLFIFIKDNSNSNTTQDAHPPNRNTKTLMRYAETVWRYFQNPNLRLLAKFILLHELCFAGFETGIRYIGLQYHISVSVLATVIILLVLTAPMILITITRVKENGEFSAWFKVFPARVVESIIYYILVVNFRRYDSPIPLLLRGLVNLYFRYVERFALGFFLQRVTPGVSSSVFNITDTIYLTGIILTDCMALFVMHFMNYHVFYALSLVFAGWLYWSYKPQMEALQWEPKESFEVFGFDDYTDFDDLQGNSIASSASVNMPS